MKSLPTDGNAELRIKAIPTDGKAELRMKSLPTDGRFWFPLGKERIIEK